MKDSLSSDIPSVDNSLFILASNFNIYNLTDYQAKSDTAAAYDYAMKKAKL